MHQFIKLMQSFVYSHKVNATTHAHLSKETQCRAAHAHTHIHIHTHARMEMMTSCTIAWKYWTRIRLYVQTKRYTAVTMITTKRRRKSGRGNGARDGKPNVETHRWQSGAAIGYCVFFQYIGKFLCSVLRRSLGTFVGCHCQCGPDSYSQWFSFWSVVFYTVTFLLSTSSECVCMCFASSSLSSMAARASVWRECECVSSFLRLHFTRSINA